MTLRRTRSFDLLNISVTDAKSRKCIGKYAIVGVCIKPPRDRLYPLQCVGIIGNNIYVVLFIMV